VLVSARAPVQDTCTRAACQRWQGGPCASVVYSLRGLRALCAATWLPQAFDSQVAFCDGLGYFSAFNPGPRRALHAAGSLLAAVILGLLQAGEVGSLLVSTCLPHTVHCQRKVSLHESASRCVLLGLARISAP